MTTTTGDKMLTAKEAAELYTQPPFTEEEIEQQIRENAKGQNYTGFDKTRLTPESRERLTANGFQVVEGILSYIVRWEQSNMEVAAA